MGSLNPAFAPPTSRKLPLAFGYVYAQGDTFASTVASDGSQIIFNALAEGEWDGPALVNTFPRAAGSSEPAVPSHLRRNYVQDPSPTAWLESLPLLMHFHSGAFAMKGAAPQATSNGPDQGVDAWFTDMPSFLPVQYFSGVAWAAWRAVLASGGINLKFGWGSLSAVTGAAVWRTTRCRIFDAYGNVSAYQFTLNPVWHRVEAILRYKVRPQQPPLAGLTAAEKACFNWESIAELAARNDYILPNGNPRFMGNYVFAADATLALMLELMCRVDRSFIREQNGQVYMIGNDTRSSIFLMSANSVQPGSVNLTKKDISKSANIFIPSYREIGIPAVAKVVSVAAVSPSGLGFVLQTPEPFVPYGVFTYGGSSNPAYDGDYQAGNVIGTTSYPDNFAIPFSGTPPSSPLSGGVVGSNDARFAQYAPATVQHRSAQRMTPAQAPGLTPQPSLRAVVYDCGNSTYDQTNRLMKFERDSTLGTDSGAPWRAPITGTLTAYLEAVDASGKALLQCAVHDVITLDDWVYPEMPGDYEIMEMAIAAPTGGGVGSISLQLRQYNAAAATDVSDPPGDSYATVPDALPLRGFAPLTNPAWTLRATPIAVIAGDSTLTITVADLLVQVMGVPAATAYPTAAWTEVPNGSQAFLYLTDAGGIGSTPTFQTHTGVPIASPAAGQMLVLSGVFTMPAGAGSGPAAAIYSPNWPGAV